MTASTSVGKGSSIYAPTNTENLERHPDVSVGKYNSIVKWCRDAIDQNADFLYDRTLFTQAIADASQRYDMPARSIISLIRNTHLQHVKIATRAVKAKIDSHYIQRYVDEGESIWQIAKSVRYPPYLLARAMSESLLNFTVIGGRKGLKDAIRDPIHKLGHVSVIQEKYQGSESFPGPHIDDESEEPHGPHPTTRLAREAMYVIALDPMYGPEHDAFRHAIGMQYERLLERLLTSMDIPFETEDQLRERGTSRTPDVLLSTPVAVQVKRSQRLSEDPLSDQNEWRIVCWIDSKAFFGDTNTHKESSLPQAESYIHRFGPGMLLYWFGHAPLLDDMNGDLVITGWTLPDEFLLPTGEVISGPSAAQTSL